MRTWSILVVAAVLGVVAGPSAMADHRPSCAQSHDYLVVDDAYVQPDPDNLDLGVMDEIELFCEDGWDIWFGHWPNLEFESPVRDPCWWMHQESAQVMILTIGTACLDYPGNPSYVSTFGTVHVT